MMLFSVLQKYSARYLDYSKLNDVYYGSANSGKSHFIAQKIITRMMLQEKLNCIAVRKVKDTCRVSVYKTMKDIIIDRGLTEFFTFTLSPLRITAINGSEINFFGLDDADKLKSIAKVEVIWMEEADQMTSDDYELLLTRFRGPYKKQMMISFNPVSISSWLYEYFMVNPDYSNTIVTHSTYLDNPYVDDMTIAALESLKDTNPLKYKIYALGEFGVIDSEYSIITIKNYNDCILRDIDAKGLLSVGIDPSGKGKDSTVITIMRGYKLLDIVRLQTDDAMEIVDTACKAMSKHTIARDNISIKLDSTGIGAYLPKIISKRVPHYFPKSNVNVHGINFSSKAINELLYHDIISEMYMNVSNNIHLYDLINDSNLQEELVSRLYSYDNKYRLQIEAKDKVKEKIRRSPDTGDSFVLCAYHPAMIKADMKLQVDRQKKKSYIRGTL